MKIENLVTLIDNRLREFKLSRDYARMSGNLEKMNSADEEIIVLEDTLYQLNLLVDVSESSNINETTLTEAMVYGSTVVLSEYDITIYATDPKHEIKVMNILSKMGVMDTVEKINDYIKGRYRSSPVTGEMVMSAAKSYEVDTRMIMAMIEQDSSFGTAGLAVRTLNPGNVGNDDDGNIRTYGSWQEGVTAVAEWLNRHRGSTIIPQIPEETVLEPTAITTPSIITPTATTTPSIIAPTATTTPSIIAPTATTTPSIIAPTATTTPSIITPTATTTPSIIAPTATTTPSIVAPTATTTPSIIAPTATTTPSIITPTATTTPSIIAPTTDTDTPDTDTTDTPDTDTTDTPDTDTTDTPDTDTTDTPTTDTTDTPTTDTTDTLTN
ncbi:MAG: hypothetical protein ACI9GH_000167 [Candidatus Paceibacteria bacterium]|jgi:hypothetical protein